MKANRAWATILVSAVASALFLPGSASADVHGCPPGYYCFYEHPNFGGMRWLVRDICSASARSIGADNKVSSWVNTGTRKIIHAYDGPDATRWLWDEPENTANPYVGDEANDRMSFWTCTRTAG